MKFRMKEFSILHERSANKVGVDGVLVGAWTDISNIPNEEGSYSQLKVLDAGCGCGLISLMIAQRLKNRFLNNFKILGIDVDADSVDEAACNVENSPWSENIDIRLMNFSQLNHGSQFHLIVSNPPFFHSGLGLDAEFSCNIDISEARLRARHAGELSPESLISNAPDLLMPGGGLSLIAEATEELSLLALANDCKLKLFRICRVIGRDGKPPKRVLLQFINAGNGFSCNSVNPTMETLIIEHSPNNFSDDYISLCKPFYIKF